MKYFKYFKKSDFSFKKKSRKEIDELITNSIAVIDCPLHDQNGLTIRTFDVLKSEKKLVTNNINIKKYDFYTQDNIFVVDGSKKVPRSFFETAFNREYALGYKYSVDNFVHILLYGYEKNIDNEV